MIPVSHGLGSTDRPILGYLTTQQNQAVLIAGLTCASVSVVATLVTLRWFMLMKRLFRHRLVLFLLLSDTFKALWYFVFPIVVFARGPVDSSSKWCQASGFLLALAVEASDFAILIIALHAVLYVFRPPIRVGEGGLYPYRHWIPVIWLGYPILAASLAFVNRGNAYVTAGTFCYLPQRPFWYRLALAWIPRYLILSTIILMYAAISIYVHIKFRGFKNLAASGDSSGSQSGRTGSLAINTIPDGKETPRSSPSDDDDESLPMTEAQPSASSRSNSYPSPTDTFAKVQPEFHTPWDSMNFITSKPLREVTMSRNGVDSADFASQRQSPPTSNPNNTIPTSGSRHKDSDVPTIAFGTAVTGSKTPTSMEGSTLVVADPLKQTRMAIRQQLRFLFIYPAVYILVWIFPFVNHCLLYSDATASHPIFALQVLATCTLSLQASVNCLIFSWREKPWRRIDEESRLSFSFWRQRSLNFVKNASARNSVVAPSRHASVDTTRRDTAATEMTGMTAANISHTAGDVSRQSRTPNWWEEEGKKRKDSVWLGTDLLTQIASRQSEGSTRRSQEDRSASV